MYGRDYGYAESRLVDSIVRIAKTGEPFWVTHVDQDDGTVEGMLLSEERNARAELDDLNLKPVPLGWCNMTRGNATYLARIPKRRDWRQGIRAETCFSSVVRFANIPHKDLAKCIRGEYPKFSELIVKPWAGVKAWSRKWASNGTLLYFGNLGAVGKIKGGEAVLDEGFLFLKESLMKSLS